MSDEKNKKSETRQLNHSSNKVEINKEQINERLYSGKLINKGYQPTDKLDTSNPPTNKRENKTK